MAEGGEGEDEIQFLRTVSKDNFIGACWVNRLQACAQLTLSVAARQLQIY